MVLPWLTTKEDDPEASGRFGIGLKTLRARRPSRGSLRPVPGADPSRRARLLRSDAGDPRILRSRPPPYLAPRPPVPIR
jgi:hypothetical protein